MKQPGKIVETDKGEIGRTFNSKGIINGKVPVYLCLEKRGLLGVCVKYSDKAILYSPSKLKIIGFID